MTSPITTTRELSAAERRDAERMRELLYGQLVSRGLCAFATLGLPGLLAERPRTVEELAERIGAHAPSLRRLLRALAAYAVVREEAGGFALTELGRTLCGDTAATAWPTASLLAGEVGAAWAELDRTVRTGRSGFETATGMTLFDYLEEADDRRRVFDRSQAAGLDLELDELLEHVAFPGHGLIIDVGGGDGAFLARLLAHLPAATGAVFDLPGTARLAERRIAETGLADRCRAEAGDFFEAVPRDGDLYILSHVLHDWSDQQVVRLLRTCARDLPGTAELLVIDLMPDGDGPGTRQTALMDLYMLTMFGGDGGRERGAEEITELLHEAGFRVERTSRMPSGMGAIHARTATAM